MSWLPRVADRVLLGGVLLLGLSLRLWGSLSDLPYVFHSDEPLNIEISQRIFKTGALNPHFFHYPSLFFYVNALAYVPYWLLGRLVGVFQQASDIAAPISMVMGTSFAPTPGVVALGRMVSVGFGTATIALVFAIGRRLGGSTWPAFLAALLTAISPTLVAHSRFVTPDTLMVFWGLVTLLASTLILQRGDGWHYGVAGLAAGCTAGTKYNGALIVACLGMAHVLRRGGKGLVDAHLFLGLSGALAGFLVTTPFVLLDYAAFATDVAYEARHYATGHPGMEGGSFAWYVSYLWRTEGLVSVLGLLQILRGVVSRRRETYLLAAFPFLYFVFISLYVVRNAQTLLPLIPFLHLLAAVLLGDLLTYGQRFATQSVRAAALAAGILLPAVAMVSPLRTTVEEARRLTTVDSRHTARKWIDENLPPGSRIALESYAPYVDGVRFALHPVKMMIDRTPDWYIANGVEYLLFSQGMYRRFYRQPGRYSREIALYDELFRRFQLTRSFTDGGYEVRLYRVSPAAQ